MAPPNLSFESVPVSEELQVSSNSSGIMHSVESYEPRGSQMGSDNSSLLNRGMPELKYAEYDKSNISSASPDG